jgi:LysM repeat protein
MEERNSRPKQSVSKLPDITILILTVLILAILYGGWEYLATPKANNNEVTSGRSRVEEPVPTLNDDQAEKISQDITDEGTAPRKAPTTTSSAEDTKSSDEKPAKDKPKESPKETKTTEGKVPEGKDYEHTVQSGETFFGIANRYNLKKSTLQALNPGIDPEGVKVGVTKLNIKIKALHTVGPGDVLRVVGQKHNISKRLIMRANRKSKDLAERGEVLIIPLKDFDKE